MIKNRQLAGSGYGTHITPLVAAVLSTVGDVVEMGMGDYSTPLLHEIIKQSRRDGSTRRLISLEGDLNWAKNFEDLKTSWHDIVHINNWEEFAMSDMSVLFIDHAPAERRVIDLHKFKDAAHIIVVHDTEKSHYYGYEPVISSFEYRFDYERYRKRTTLVSNYIDVTKLL